MVGIFFYTNCKAVEEKDVNINGKRNSTRKTKKLREKLLLEK